jgi:hypothetical protein
MPVVSHFATVFPIVLLSNFKEDIPFDEDDAYINRGLNPWSSVAA